MIMPKPVDLDFGASTGTAITSITASKTLAFGNNFNPRGGNEQPMRGASATLMIILLLSGCIGQGGQGNNPEIDDGDDDETGGDDAGGVGGDGTGGGTDNGTTTPPPDNDSMFTFTSGFGQGVSILPYDDRLADIVGADNSSNHSDWQTDLETGAPFGDARFFFEGGNDSQRSARIVDENGEDVLEFRLAEANVNDGEKGRVSIRISSNENLTRFGYSVDVKLKDAFDLISQSNQTVNWLTLAEFWNDGPEKEFSFRITLAIHKESAVPGTPLTWNIHGQTQNNETLAWDDVWDFSSNAPVPLDEWFKLEVEIIEGDFTDADVVQACILALSGAKAGLVISDIAPNLSGVRATDQARGIYLAELVLAFADEVLAPGGDILVKMFQGEGTDQYTRVESCH